MLLAIILALVISVTVSFLTQTVFTKWIENDYNSEESRKQRYEDYVASLQSFVDKNGLSSEDTDQITRWVRSNRNVYLFIYKDNQLFFDSSIQPKPEKPESDENDEETNESEENSSENENTDSSSENEKNDESQESTEKEENDGNSDKEDSGDTGGINDNNGETEENSGNGASSSGTNSESDKSETTDKKDPVADGITIQYPTRDEIIASAKNNGLLPLNLSDGMLFVSLADFTEYLYYDIANIASIVVGVFLLILILMLYFQNIISKISRLAKDVSTVYEVDMNTKIRTNNGNDELSKLTRNVEQMRSSMMESLENEKAAINSNTELITSMSHDIRTPLTVLLGYLDIMKHHSTDEDMQEYIKASELTALKLKNLSDDMFRYFLVFGEKEIKVEMVEYDAKTLFDQLLSEHMLLLGERGYDVSIDLEERITPGITVLTDAPNLMRVIDNLFSNVYKYADKRQKIKIESKIAGDTLVLTFENHILEPSIKSESSGVGLKTCKKLCEAMDIKFDYGAKNEKGSSVFVTVMKIPIKRK